MHRAAPAGDPAPDPFGTAELRHRVLAAWAASPERFREDANAEEDLVHGGYRDRLVVELAQNAADAAGRAAVPGRLLLRLDPGPERPAGEAAAGTLVAASTGAGLDAAGVRALASLRASAKREPAGADVGRFGVGFAAVLAVSDAPALLTRTGGVRFSRSSTAELVREAALGSPGLGHELDRRDGHVPALRLPFPASGVAPQGYDAVVLLPLRDDAAASLARTLLGGVDDALLLALPGLSEVVVELPGDPPRRFAEVGRRWHVLRREGRLDPALLAGRPTEERSRTRWSLTWALPRSGGGLPPGIPAVVHAPTPTDDPLDLPALLVANLPLGPDRRRVAPGPVTDVVLEHAAHGYGDLLAERAAAGDDVLPLVPTGLAAGEVDAALRRRVLAALPGVPLLRGVEDGRPLRGRDAVVLRGAAGAERESLAVLAPLLAGLVAAPPGQGAALRALGVVETDLADVVEAMPADADPVRWRRRYAGLAGLRGAAETEALAALPVPLADGRVVRGVRGLLLPGPALAAVPPAALARLGGTGLRLVHPDAVHPLLERLGARPAGPADVLRHAACRALVEQLADAADADGEVDPDAVDCVLHLLAAAGDDVAPGALPWLGDLPLPDADGEPAPAAALVLPGSLAEAVLDPEQVGVLDAEVAARWPERALVAAGVAAGPSVVRAADVDLDDVPETLLEVPGVAAWARRHGPGSAAEVAGVLGLDLVREDAWPRLLGALAADPAARAALVDPVRLLPPPGRHGPVRRVPGPAAAYLATRLGVAAHADPQAPTGVAAALPAAPGWVASLPPALRGALGLVRRWRDLDAAGWSAALQATGRPGHEVAVADLLTLWRELARAAPADLDLPARLRCLTADGRAVVLPAEQVVVPEAPMWCQRDDLGGLLPVPGPLAERLADVLDLDLAGEVAASEVGPGQGTAQDVPAAASALVPGAPRRWWRHPRLHVDGVRVRWWVAGEGRGAQLHAESTAALAPALAQAAGRWELRWLLAAVLAEPAAAGRLLVQAGLDTADLPAPASCDGDPGDGAPADGDALDPRAPLDLPEPSDPP